MRTERPAWLALFVLVSLLIHGIILWLTRARAMKPVPQPPGLEITLQPPPKPKAIPPKPKPKPPVTTARRTLLPKPARQTAHRPSRAPRIAERHTTPRPRVAAAIPRPDRPRLLSASSPRLLSPASAPRRIARQALSAPAPRTARSETPEPAPGPVRRSAPPLRTAQAPSATDNPLAGLAAPEEQPRTADSQPRSLPVPAIPRTAAIPAHAPAPARAPAADTPGEALPWNDGSRVAPHVAARTGAHGGGSPLAMDNPLAGLAAPDETPTLGGSGQPRFAGKPGGISGGSRAAGLPGGGHGLRIASIAGTGGGAGAGGHAGRGSGSGGAGAGGIGKIEEPPGGTGGDSFGDSGHGIAGGTGGDGFGSGRFRHGSAAGLLGDGGDDWGPRAPGDGRAGSGGHGLLAQIFVGQTLTGHALLRTDADIDFNWGATAAVARGISRHFSVRWTGSIQPDATANYTFSTFADDGARVWIDGHEIIDDWADHAAVPDYGRVALEAGHRYRIRIDYYENGIGHAEMHLRWSRPGMDEQVVPERCLYQE